MRRFAPLLAYVPVLVAVAWLAGRARIVFGLFLIAHGLVHVLFVVPEPEPKPGGPAWPFHLDRSWLLSRIGVPSGPTRAIGVGLMMLSVAAFAAAGIAVLADTGWWGTASVVAASSSVALLVVTFHPWLVLGVAIDAYVFSVAALGWPAIGYLDG